jgi:N utilization substance protein B
MKTSKDPRHIYRKQMIKYLFAESFAHQKKIPENVSKIFNLLPVIDNEIKNAAPAWPINKINKIDLAILRLAIFELKEKTAPQKVVIDEAVEIAKEYGSESSSSFINGVLGTIYETKE